MIIIQSNNFYQHKDVLMSQKCGDTFSININLKNGTRFYNVVWGRKWVTFKSMFGQEKIKMHVKNAREVLKTYYWRAARSKVWEENCLGEKRRKSLPKNWEADY